MAEMLRENESKLCTFGLGLWRKTAKGWETRRKETHFFIASISCCQREGGGSIATFRRRRRMQ